MKSIKANLNIFIQNRLSYAIWICPRCKQSYATLHCPTCSGLIPSVDTHAVALASRECSLISHSYFGYRSCEEYYVRFQHIKI